MKQISKIDELKPQEISFEINSEEDLVRLNLVLKKCIECNKKIDEKLDPRIAEANKTHKGLTALKKETKKPWDEVIDKIKLSLKVWYANKEEEAKQLQQKINEDLSKKANEYKEELLQEAANSDEWSAEVLKEKASEIVAQSVELKDCKETIGGKQEGQYKRSNWKARIFDENRIPREYLCPDLKKIDEFAKKYKGELAIQGVEIYDDFSIITKV